MAKFRHSMAWTEEFGATQKNTGKAQPRLLIKTENGKEVERWPSSARSWAMSQGGLQRCSAAGQGSYAPCTEPLGRSLWTPEAELDQHRGTPEMLRGDLPETYQPEQGYRSRPPQIPVTYTLFCVPQGVHLEVDNKLAEHIGFHPTSCWTFLTWKINVREEGILQGWAT